MSVVMDTNALMMPVECDVRVFEELRRLVGSTELVVPDAVLAELEKLAEGNGAEAAAASVGLDLARDRCRAVSHDESYADDAVVEVATRDDVTHAVTNDRPLKRRLLDAGVPVICLRGRNKLAVTQP
ncbi:twitching motility protein PilT [Haloarculaceae archaeon H-GB2-1]|nr:twitching motility protein PilT [Haloarculaceae archaeon H-GB1-1]MEA5406889.1 twitching motility protein PilT [Haloarculaceae archaeon H-GB2-1]